MKKKIKTDKVKNINEYKKEKKNKEMGVHSIL